jgi:hypothetical protein
MKIRELALLLITCVFARADSDPGIASRRESSFHLLALCSAADAAVKNWLLTHVDLEEEVEARRYFPGDIDGDGAEDLLLVTSFTKASGNYWSHDFVLILASSPDRPIIANFGGKGVRSYKTIYVGSHGIFIDALYYSKSDALCCPSIMQKVHYVLRNHKLIEAEEK